MRQGLAASALAMAATLAAMAGCGRHQEAPRPAAKPAKAAGNVGDQAAADLHDKLDRAKAVEGVLDKSAQDASDKIDEATR